MNLTVNILLTNFCALALTLTIGYLVGRYARGWLGPIHSTISPPFTTAVIVPLLLVAALATLYFYRHDALTATRISFATEGHAGRVVTDAWGQKYLLRHTWGGAFSVQEQSPNLTKEFAAADEAKIEAECEHLVHLHASHEEGKAESVSSIP